MRHWRRTDLKNVQSKGKFAQNCATTHLSQPPPGGTIFMTPNYPFGNNLLNRLNDASRTALPAVVCRAGSALAART